MKVFTYNCVALEDFCESAGWDYESTSDAVRESDISYGCNDDTLVRVGTLCDICEKAIPENVDPEIMISLGC